MPEPETTTTLLERGALQLPLAMFTDSRSRKVVFVAHCVLNQNAKIDRCARYPGAMRELAEYLVASGLGVIQMPCPELMCLGLDRQADALGDATVESEDTRVAFRMRDKAAEAVCTRLVEDVALQMREYTKNGFEIAGILGINGSPTCGVEANWYENEEAPGPGVFIRALQEWLLRDGVSVPMRGVKAADPERAVEAAKELLVPPSVSRS
jgi:predicted secreted protein